MTETIPIQEERAQEEQAAPPEPAGPPPEPPRRRVDWAAFAWIPGVFALIVLGVFLWKYSLRPPPAPDESHAMATLQQQIQALDAKVAQLAARKPPTVPDIGPLEARVAALEKRPAAPADTANADVVKRLAQQQQADEKELAALAVQIQQGNGGLANQVAAATQRMDALISRVQADSQAMSKRLGALEAQMTKLDTAVQQVPALAHRAALATRLQAAEAALAAGEKLGSIPGAPPALTRFADTAPPTEAALRLEFPAFARRAAASSQPDSGGKGFLNGVWARISSAVTIRKGDQVIVGDPAAGVLARARRALDAGDLAGAVAALTTLTGGPAAAMAPWLDQAKALLAARAALAQMAAHA